MRTSQSRSPLAGQRRNLWIDVRCHQLEETGDVGALRARKVKALHAKIGELTVANGFWLPVRGCTDPTRIPLARAFLYLVAIMDCWSRKVLAWRLSNTIGGHMFTMHRWRRERVLRHPLHQTASPSPQRACLVAILVRTPIRALSSSRMVVGRFVPPRSTCLEKSF